MPEFERVRRFPLPQCARLSAVRFGPQRRCSLHYASPSQPRLQNRPLFSAADLALARLFRCRDCPWVHRQAGFEASPPTLARWQFAAADHLTTDVDSARNTAPFQPSANARALLPGFEAFAPATEEAQHSRARLMYGAA